LDLKNLGPQITIANLFSPLGKKWNHTFLPLGSLYIVAALERAGIPVNFRDYQVANSGQNPYQVENVAAFLRDENPILGVGLMAPMLPFLLKALETVKARDPGKIVVLGGTGVTGVGEAIIREFPQVDIVVHGEGEETAVELFGALLDRRPLNDIAGISYRQDGRAVTNPPRAMIQDLNAVSPPAHGIVDLSCYKVVSCLSARGCPFKCTYCYSSMFWKRYRPRSIVALIDEIEGILRQTGGDNISILDDTFVLEPARVLEFCSELQRRRLALKWTCFGRVGLMKPELLEAIKDAGCTGVGFGVESGSNEILARIKKGYTREAAIDTIRLTAKYFRNMEMFFMYGFPFEERRHFEETISLVELLRAELVEQQGINARFSFNLLAAVPGTELTREFRSLMRPLELHKASLYSHEDKRAMMKRPWFFLPSPNARWLPQMIADHPDIFSGFYCFENPDLGYKARFLWKNQRRYRARK
jgi:anaerobic magnesium-protoporphyrin IX monomethyl ester cyclase